MTQQHARDPLEGDRTASVGGGALLVLVSTCIFVVPVFPAVWHKPLFGGMYTAIFIMAALALERRRKLILSIGVGVAALEWLAVALDMVVLTTASQLFNGLFFLFVVGRLIVQIAGTRTVNPRVILAAVNGYLLLGLAASIAVAMVAFHNPDAISFPTADTLPGGESVSQFSNHLYFGFVTLTTMGYGDVVPRAPFARSLAILIGVMGQMYLAIIIATLVGKWASSYRQ